MSPSFHGDGVDAVAVFGDSDTFNAALQEELVRRGSSVHTISVSSGWLPSVRCAVLRLDTAAGTTALTALGEVMDPPAHVVAVCREQDEAAAAHLSELCRRCGEHHDVSLLWHDAAPADLASTVADEVAAAFARPSTAFTSRHLGPH